MSLPVVQRRDGVASSEDFGDEVVVIHHDTGVFYSISGWAIALWRALEHGVDQTSLDGALAGLDATDATEAATVRTMLDELTSSGIVATTDGDGAAAPFVVDSTTIATMGPARFQSNSDFDDLIRLDPIHDVSDAGWPNRDDSTG